MLERVTKIKTVLQAVMSSVIIHLVYIVGQMVVGYIKTRNYKLDIVSARDKGETLQNDVVFGKAISPFIYLLTFIGVTVICGIFIFLYKKLLY